MTYFSGWRLKSARSADCPQSAAAGNAHALRVGTTRAPLATLKFKISHRLIVTDSCFFHGLWPELGALFKNDNKAPRLLRSARDFPDLSLIHI